ncbi:MAG: hypothetical protein IPM32_07830 [Ignavibacteriae bacterium]|nr:hypothetical protein [Ignavibacteriota bacterium]
MLLFVGGDEYYFGRVKLKDMKMKIEEEILLSELLNLKPLNKGLRQVAVLIKSQKVLNSILNILFFDFLHRNSTNLDAKNIWKKNQFLKL